jgi:hypothetical protein
MVFYIMDNAKSKVTLDHCNHAGFFFFHFPPQQTNWEFFLKICVFLVQILLKFLFLGNFSNFFNIKKLKKKGKKKQVLFLVMNFFIFHFSFSQQ